MYLIRTEERGLRTMQMAERPIQQEIYKYAEDRRFRGIRRIDLKSRKQGVTTFWGLFYLDDTMMTPNTTSCILAHKEKDVRKIFRIVKTAFKYCPEYIEMADGRIWQKPSALYDNVNELVFDGINSTIYVALESRGDTNNNLHVSEAAHIPNAAERMAGTLESVPNIELGSNITIESTAAGVGGWFHDFWYDSESKMTGFDPVFKAWFMKPSNRLTPPADFYPTPEEEQLVARVIERYGVTLTFGQLFWWRMTKAQQRKLMNQEHPTFPDDAFLSSGMMVFDEDTIKGIIPKTPIRHLKNGAAIFVEPKPGRRYIIGGDPAEGVGGDASVAEVYDMVTLEQVAEYRNDRVSPNDFGEKVLPELGFLYNEAMIAPERNNHGHLVIDRLRRVYTRIFMQMTYDERAQKRTKKLGWNTNAHTRDMILDEFEEAVNDGTAKINSAILKSEMLTFVTNEDGKREAKQGYHDDTIMASAIAVKIASMPKSSYGIYEIN